METLEMLFDDYILNAKDCEAVRKAAAVIENSGSVEETDKLEALFSESLYQESRKSFTAGFKSAIRLLVESI